ncbi:MAG TPA: hypothetical protein VHM70_25190, partial [Polyangiaceae bacterium]|nr:hypothetical protein [Polyangiaceae bacterium]HEX2734935.1 hypothetical protein [Polyangiaceae bacterium]
TDADRTRVIDGLADSSRTTDHLLEDTIKHIAPRWFVVRDVHQSGAPVLLQPRYAMSLLRGPMTRTELKRALELQDADGLASRSRAV